MGLLDSIFLGGEIERGKQLDSQIRDLNRQKEEAGVITPGQREAYDAALNTETEEIWRRQVNQDFDSGLQQGYENVTGGIKSAINAPARFLWDSIPWWVWGGLVSFGLWQLGSVRAWIKRLVKV